MVFFLLSNSVYVCVLVGVHAREVQTPKASHPLELQSKVVVSCVTCM